MCIKEPLVSSSLRWYRSRWANRHLRCADGISLCLCSLGYISTSILTYRYGKYDGSWDEGKIRIKRNCVSNTSKICRRHASRWKAMQATGRYHKNRLKCLKIRQRPKSQACYHPSWWSSEQLPLDYNWSTLLPEYAEAHSRKQMNLVYW